MLSLARLTLYRPKPRLDFLSLEEHRLDFLSRVNPDNRRVNTFKNELASESTKQIPTKPLNKRTWKSHERDMLRKASISSPQIIN